MATKADKQRIVDILSSEEYDTPEQMAGAILKEAALILNQSDGWVAITRIPAKVVFPFELWGIYDNKTEANKIGKLFDGNIAFRKVNGLTTLAERGRLVEPEAVKRSDCSKCTHPLFTHWPGSKSMKQGCRTVGCTCTDGPGSAYKK